MSVTVMSGAARALVLDLQERSIDPSPYLVAAGLTLEEVLDPDRRIAIGRTEALWQAAAEQMGSPLRAAARLPLGAYRVLDFLCAHTATVGSGLKRVAAYFSLVDPRVRLVVEEGASCTVTMTAADGASLPRVAQEFTLAAIVVRHRRFSGVDWPLTRVELQCEPPADASEHQSAFNAPVLFRQPAPRLVLTPETFLLPVPTAEPQLLPLLDEHARLQLAQLQLEDEPIAGFREALRVECVEGRPTLPSVAKRLGVPARTLQRRLREVGATFSQLTDRHREAHARMHLADRTLAIAEVAFMLGFSDQAAFTKAFTRWTGTTPHAYRTALRQI